MLPAQGDALYIAMAGQHQIWVHDLRAGTTRAFSGDGYERMANGRSGPSTSWAQVLSQPILRFSAMLHDGHARAAVGEGAEQHPYKHSPDGLPRFLAAAEACRVCHTTQCDVTAASSGVYSRQA